MQKKSLWAVYIFISIIFLSVFWQCANDPFNLKADIPSYIKIDSVNFTTDYGLQGTNSHAITDVWLYVDDELIGCFELPATIPVINTGNRNIKIKAGIKMNGINSTRIRYSFYTTYETTLELIENQSHTIYPSFTYKDNVTFAWLEDFEDIGITLDTLPNTELHIQRIDGDSLILTGNKSGYVQFNDSVTLFECVSAQEYELPKAGADVFVEINYKNSIEMVVGLISHEYNVAGIKHSILALNKRDDWNKIYINLTQEILRNPNAETFSIFFGAIKNDDDTDDAEIFIDNIKLIHFNQ